jgi:hypothetical protein
MSGSIVLDADDLDDALAQLARHFASLAIDSEVPYESGDMVRCAVCNGWWQWFEDEDLPGTDIEVSSVGS